MRRYYEKERQRYLDDCTQCGLCAQCCPILPLTDAGADSPQNIQKGVHAFVSGGGPNPLAYTKAFACMECFKCTADVCPEGLDPMLVNEWIKHDYIAKGLAQKAGSSAGENASAHRVLASIQVSAEAYRRITTASPKPSARYVFFPGCNVYFQPEKVLNTMDIFDAIGDDWAFLPGLDYCCGDRHLFTGEIDAGAATAEALVEALARYRPETVVLWCPTCHCRFTQTIEPAMDLPFKVLSFPQYLAANMAKLPLNHAAGGTITLHEACKSAYTGVDLDGPRAVLRQLPGVSLVEMARHGRETACCGSGAICWFPESCDRIREERLAEAAQTGADRMVTVCHYCNETFAAHAGDYDFSVTSYVNLVAAALGIHREEKFTLYASWGDPERILEDAAGHIAASPFPYDRIAEVVQTVFGNGTGDEDTL